MVGKSIKGLEKQLIVAVSNPIRLAALTILTERVASPAQIARAIGENVSNVAHHVRVLEEFDKVEFVEERPVRGAMEHFYRATGRPLLSTEEWSQMPLRERENFSEYGVQQIIADAVIAIRARTFDSRVERQMTRVPMMIDEEGWQRLSKAYDELLDTVFEIQAESDERCLKSGGEAFPVSASALAVPMPAVRRIDAD